MYLLIYIKDCIRLNNFQIMYVNILWESFKINLHLNMMGIIIPWTFGNVHVCVCKQRTYIIRTSYLTFSCHECRVWYYICNEVNCSDCYNCYHQYYVSNKHIYTYVICPHLLLFLNLWNSCFVTLQNIISMENQVYFFSVFFFQMIRFFCNRMLFHIWLCSQPTLFWACASWDGV